MYFGVAVLSPPRSKGGPPLIIPAQHNLSHEALQALLGSFGSTDLKKVIKFTHALEHSGEPFDCAGCVSALNEFLDMAEEDYLKEKEREQRSAGPPEPETPADPQPDADLRSPRFPSE